MASYSSASSRRSHRSSHHQPQPILWSLPTTSVQVQGPPSHLYATYFSGGYSQAPEINHAHNHRSRHYSYSQPSRSSIYPPPISIPPNPHSLRPRRQSTGDGPRVSPQHIHPPPHAQPQSYSSSSSRSHPSPAYHPHTKSILKNGSPPPQTPYLIPPTVRRRGLSFSAGMRNLLGKRTNPGLPLPPPTMAPSSSRRVRFDLPPESNDPWRRR